MEQVLLFLKSHAEPWQSFSSVYLDTVPSCIFLIVVGLLLLYLCYLLLPTKHPGRAKRRQKGGTFRGWRSHRRKTEETRKLLSILKSPLGHHHDSTPFRHMLCPEPSCEVCNRTTAEIQQLLSQGSLQHAALSQYFSPSSDSMIESSVSLTSDLLAIAPGDPIPPPVPEPSPSPCSTLSTNLDTSFEDLISPSNLPPKPTPGLDFSFPGGHFPTQPLRILPPPPCPGQGTDPVLQGEVTVTLGDSVCGLPTHEPKTKATQSPDMATSEIWPQGRTKHLPISNWAQGDAKQNILALSSSKAPIGVDREASLLGNLLFLSPDALALLERQVRKRGDFLIHREREKTAGPFPKQHRPDVPLHSPGKMLESVSVKHDSAVSLPHWSSKGKPQEMHLDQQSLYSKTFEDHLQKKCIQLPWDRPALNHDFLYPAGLVSGRCSSTLVVFSSVYDTSTAQEPPAVPDPQAQESPELPDPQAQDSPELPDPQTQESPELPDPQAQDSPELPDPQAQDSPVVPDPQAQESPELPDPQAQNSPDRPDPQAQESSTVPDPQAQESPELPDPQPLLEPEIQSQPLPQDMRQPQSQVPTENQPQSSVPILPPYSLPQISTSGVGLHELLNEAEALLPSETQHLEHHLLKKKQENLWGLPSVVCKSQKDFCPPTPNLSLVSQSSKPHISISILPGDFVLNSELREKLEHHLLKRLIQNRWGLPCKVLESLFLINPQRDGSDTSESKSNQDLSGVCLFKGQISKDVVDLGLSQPGSFYKRTLEILPLEDVRKSRRPTQESGLSDHLMSDSRKSSDMDLWSDSEEDLECQVLNLSGNNSRASCMSLNEKQLENDLKANLSKKGKEIKESPIRRTLPGSQHSIKKTLPLSEKSCRRGKQKDSVPLVSRTSNVNTSNEISFLCSSNKKMLEYHIKSFRLRMIWGLPKKVLDSIEVFKMKEELAQCTDHYNFPSSANLISEVDSQLSVSQSFTDSISLLEDKVGTRICDSDLDHQFPATTAVHKPCRGSSISLHGNKVGTRVSDSSLDRSFPTTSPVCKPYRGSSISLHGGKVGTRVSDSSLDCPFPATSPVCKPSRKNSVALHGHKLGRRVSVSSLDHSSPATSPVREPFRGSSISLHGDKVGTRVCVSDRDHPFPAISTVCKPNSKSSVVLQGHKVGRRVSLSNLDHPFPVTSPVCKPCRGNSVAFLGDKIGRRISVPGLDHTSPATSPVCKPHRANSIAFLGDRTGRRVSDPRLDRPSPPTSHVCRPHRANSVALLGDRTGRRVTDSRLDRSSPPTSPVCRPLRGSPIFLHGDKVGIRISVSDPDRPSRAPSPVNEPYSVSCISLHGDKVRTRVSDSSLCRPAATSLESVPCRGSSISLHGGEMGRRISSSSLDHHFPVTSPVSQPYRGSCISLHGDKLGIKISFSDLDHPFPLTSHMYKPYRGSSIALHGDKVGTRVSDSSLDRPSPATSPVCMPCRGSSISFHGDKVGIRISAPGLDHDFPATSPVCKPYRGSSMSFLGNMIGKRMSVSNVDHHFPATSTVCRCYRGSSISLHGDKVGTRISNPDPDDLFPVTSPVCRPYRGSSISLHGDKVGTRLSIPGLDRPFPSPSPVCKPCRGTAISLHGDKVGTRLSVSGLDRLFPHPSPVSKPCRGDFTALHGDKVGARICAISMDHHSSVTSPVCKKRQGVLRKTSCDITYERIDDIQRLNDCRKHFLPCTDDAIDKARQKPPALANRCSPTLPRRQIMAGPEPSDNTGISRNRTERLQGKHLKNLEHFPTDKKSVEIFRARERCALPSPWSKTFTTNEPKSSPVIGMTLGEKRTMLTSKHPPPKISEPRNSKLSGINTKLLCELKLNLDNTDDRQTHDHSTDPSLASGNLKCRPALTYTRGTHTRHTADSQVWHVHGENTGISREQMQEPCVPVCVLRKNQGKNLPAASKTVSPPEPKPEELGGGDAGLGPSQPRRRIRAAQGGTLKDTLESKYSPTQPLKGQPPAESHFRKRMKHFLQWIWPSRRCERQNRFLEQGRSLSSEQSMGPGKNQATCIGNTEVQSVKPASGKVPGKKLGHDHGTGKTCHQVPLSTQVKFSKTQRQAELQMGAAPVQGHPFNHRVTSCKGTSTKSCRQEAAFAGQSYPARNTHMKHRDREPKKVVPFRDQLWCQRYPERACATSKPCL
nr:spermatogenesis-associated protein 31D1 isoform X18 [Oryctolagus cuniculus]